MLLNLNSVFLPQDIITEILARLPANSLLRFKCISRSWLCCVSAPQFVKYHLKISSSLPRILLSNCYCHPPKNDVILMNCYAHSFISEHISYPFKQNQIIQGSCNGLVCVATINGEDVFLWNPCTRKSQQLPRANVKMDNPYYTFYGFAYNESKDDYYVIGFFQPFATPEPEVHIYSLKNNSWKVKEGFRVGSPLFGKCVVVVGKFHVLRYNTVSLEPVDIVSFDLGDGDYGEIELPNYGKGAGSVLLEVLEERICVLCRKQYHADFWVMKEYGVTESWAKTLTIPTDNFPMVVRYLKPLVTLPCGKMLLLIERQVVVYDLKDKNSMWSLDTGDLVFRKADVFVDSLVSPHKTSEACMKEHLSYMK